MSAGKTSRLTVREIAELSLICALMVAGKESLRIVPNVHPVTLLLLLATAVYGAKALYPAFGFALLEIALYGAGLWNLMYLYVWPRAVRHPVFLYRWVADGLFVVALGHPV